MFFIKIWSKLSWKWFINNCQFIWEWIRGYATIVGHTTSVAAELWALRDGINSLL